MPATEALRGIPMVIGGVTVVGQSSAPNSNASPPLAVGSGASTSTPPAWSSILGLIMVSAHGSTSSSVALGAAVGIHRGVFRQYLES